MQTCRVSQKTYRDMALKLQLVYRAVHSGGGGGGCRILGTALVYTYNLKLQPYPKKIAERVWQMLDKKLHM